MVTNTKIHKQAICESEQIGDTTSIGAFSQINKTAKIGDQCLISSSVTIGSGVTIGNNVTIQANVQLLTNTLIKNNVTLGANTVLFTEHSENKNTHTTQDKVTTINEHVYISANVTLAAGINIGHHALIRAGTVIRHDVPAYAVVEGNPAEIISYRSPNDSAGNAPSIEATIPNPTSKNQEILQLGVGSSELWNLPCFEDMRGDLVVTEFSKDLPFNPQRCFVVHGVPNNKIRGEHAHKQCEQFLIAISGEVSIIVDDGIKRKEVRLKNPSQGVYMPAGLWGVQYKFSKKASLLVFASHPYDSHDYIRNYADFLSYVNSKKT